MSSAPLPVDYLPSPSSGGVVHVQDPLLPHDDDDGEGEGIIEVAGGPDGRGYSYVTSASSASSDSILGVLTAEEEGHHDGTRGSDCSGREEH